MQQLDILSLHKTNAQQINLAYPQQLIIKNPKTAFTAISNQQLAIKMNTIIISNNQDLNEPCVADQLTLL